MSGLEQQVIEPMRRVSGPIQPELTRSRMQLANVAVGATPAVALQSSADRNPPSCDVHARDPQRSLYVDSSRPECANSGHSPTACGTVRDPSETILSAPTDDVLGVKRSCSSPVWTTQMSEHVPFASKASRPECVKSKPWPIEKMERPRLVESFPGSGER
jgi:hypothetical protein